MQKKLETPSPTTLKEKIRRVICRREGKKEVESTNFMSTNNPPNQYSNILIKKRFESTAWPSGEPQLVTKANYKKPSPEFL